MRCRRFRFELRRLAAMKKKKISTDSPCPFERVERPVIRPVCGESVASICFFLYLYIAWNNIQLWHENLLKILSVGLLCRGQRLLQIHYDLSPRQLEPNPGHKMYTRMELTTNEFRREEKSKKQYNLSLKRSKQNVRPAPSDSIRGEAERAPPVVLKTREDTISELGDSQNFMLRLSNSFSTDDTPDEPNGVESPSRVPESKPTEVILISDSSDDASPGGREDARFKSSESWRRTARNGNSRPRSIYLIESSTSEDCEERPGSSTAGIATEKLPAKGPPRCSILYTSDEHSNENESVMSFGDKENISKSRDENHVGENIIEKVDKTVGKTDGSRGILTDNRCNIYTPERAKTINKEDTRKNVVSRATPISAKSSNRTPLLTRRETRNILKTIKSTRLVYESPTEWKKSSHVSDSDTDESEVSSKVTKNKDDQNIVRRNAVIIAETDSDSDDKVIEGSRADSAKPWKTHVSRFLDPAVTDEASLSEKKKLEIAQWLMTNSRDSRSDSSISNVSASQKNSPNSGNSSLERLEMNYETPNNRGKLQTSNNRDKFETPKNGGLFRTPNIGARLNVEPTSAARSVKSVRQTTIDTFIKTSKDGTRKILGFNESIAVKGKDLVSPAVKKSTETMGLMDCADILDKLYGETWRAKANDVIPATEPRKTNIARKDKAVQTERKINPRSKKVIGESSVSSSPVDDFDKFMKDIRPNLNSTKKPVSKANRRRCSFINDTSSSSDNGESSFMTALTTPRISDNRKLINRQTPASATLQRVKAICDSDSEDEKPKRKEPTNYRKQLSFSDDESGSSTSEYDPSDVIPPKVTAKPPIIPAKVTRAPIYEHQKRINKSKTFLESLAATIPLTEAHPDAKKYRQNFKNTREELCKYLYKMYNDKIFDNKLPSDMTIEWNVRMRGTAGFCYNKRSVKALGGVTRSSRLVLATKILDTPDRLRDTLVHEMCHAAAWLINEVSDGHGPFWKGWASKAMKAFPELPPIRRCHDYEIKTKFTYRCVGCGYSIGRHSKSLDVEKKRCGHCYGKFELLINKTTKSGTVEVRTPTTKKPTAFALFVKENYHSVKKEQKGVAHKEVMKILGQQFSAIKISKKNGNSDENNSDGVSKDS